MRSIIQRISLALIAIFLVSCDAKKAEDMISDPHSYANINEVKIKHLDLTLEIDFETKVMHGIARLDIENKAGADSLILDTYNLNIEKITIDDKKQESEFRLGEFDKMLGAPLRIPIKKFTQQVTVYYTTSPEASAVQWLSPEQTAGGKQPFLFTQNQPIFARTWIPCMDSPAVRMTYTATVTVPSDLMAVMSAENPQKKNDDGTYTFNMPQPIPSYLIALAVGDIAFAPLGEICGVYAEPSVVEKAAKEFEDTEAMIKAAETLYGPYRWGRYDVIVLPPSFPFGGMENPRLTFATPTILAGDKSLVSLIAHELAHSWSGNLVTNANWNDIWLNEGFTTYFEHRIMEEIYGDEIQEMLATLEYQKMIEALDRMGRDNPKTALHQELGGDDPDAPVSAIVYDKGHFFLRTMEEELGREKWDAFLKDYFNSYAFKTMTSEKFLKIMQRNLVKGNEQIAETLQLERWIFEPGLPENHAVAQSKELEQVNEQLNAFKNGMPPTELKTSDWQSHHWRYFLNNLPKKMSTEQMKQLDAAFGFTETGNSEMLFTWLIHAIHNRYYPAYLSLEHFLTSMGRLKFLLPLYNQLAQTDEGKEMAKRIYQNTRATYHPISIAALDRTLNWER